MESLGEGGRDSIYSGVQGQPLVGESRDEVPPPPSDIAERFLVLGRTTEVL